jgi:hypothetical protein
VDVCGDAPPVVDGSSRGVVTPPDGAAGGEVTGGAVTVAVGAVAAGAVVVGAGAVAVAVAAGAVVVDGADVGPSSSPQPARARTAAAARDGRTGRRTTR